MPHPLFSPEIRDMLEQQDQAGLAALCEELHPATIAEIVEDDFSADEVWQLISHSDTRTQAAIFEYLPTSLQATMLEEGTNRVRVGELVSKMSHDDRVELLRRLPKSVNETLLRSVDAADRLDIKTLFEYGSNTVGAIMTTDYAWLPATLTAAEAVDQLRVQAPDRETIYYIYVLEEAKKQSSNDYTPTTSNKPSLLPRELLGVISLRDLILAPRHVLIKDLMETELLTLKYHDDRERAAELLGRYDFIAVPVVDDRQGMLGIVTHDDALDVVTQEATEDMQRQGGVSPIIGNYLEASFGKVWYSRALWLSILFAAQMITVYVMARYEGALQKITILATFIPLCLSVGGNAGSQAATLVTRALALEQIRVKDWFRVLRRELYMGVALASTLSFLALIRTWFLTPGEINQNTDMLMKLTWVISLSVLGICLWGTLLGSMLPIFFKKLGVDPALTSSPFIATLSDVSGIFIYFNVAFYFFY